MRTSVTIRVTPTGRRAINSRSNRLRSPGLASRPLTVTARSALGPIGIPHDPGDGDGTRSWSTSTARGRARRDQCRRRRRPGAAASPRSGAQRVAESAGAPSPVRVPRTRPQVARAIGGQQRKIHAGVPSRSSKGVLSATHAAAEVTLKRAGRGAGRRQRRQRSQTGSGPPGEVIRVTSGLHYSIRGRRLHAHWRDARPSHPPLRRSRARTRADEVVDFDK